VTTAGPTLSTAALAASAGRVTSKEACWDLHWLMSRYS
jgi:hypothetical protein